MDYTVHSVEFVVAVVRMQQSGFPGRTLARTESTELKFEPGRWAGDRRVLATSLDAGPLSGGWSAASDCRTIPIYEYTPLAITIQNRSLPSPWASCGPRQPIIQARPGPGTQWGRNGTQGTQWALRYPRRSGRTRDRQSGLSAPCPLARLLILACARVQVSCIQLTRRATVWTYARWSRASAPRGSLVRRESWSCLFPPASPRNSSCLA